MLILRLYRVPLSEGEVKMDMPLNSVAWLALKNTDFTICGGKTEDLAE